MLDFCSDICVGIFLACFLKQMIFSTLQGRSSLALKTHAIPYKQKKLIDKKGWSLLRILFAL